jgi:glycyl-tRNA synthetase beta chain
MGELLLELFSEEIPARMQPSATADLERLMTAKFKAAGLTFTSMKGFATPRRLTLVVDGLPKAQPDVREERKGPRADAPEKAIEGFLKSAGVKRKDVEIRETDKGTVLFAVIERKGRPTPEVIAEAVPEIIREFPWPKSMRTGMGNLRWVRPMHSILCLFDGKVVPFTIEGLKSGDVTRGHRFMGPAAFKVKSFAEYRAKLREAHVIVDADERKEIILNGAKRHAEKAKLELIPDDALAVENAGLTEWPIVHVGSFEPAFLDVPQEVLTATMRGNQKYFSLRDPKAGALAPKFIIVSNRETKDGGKAVIHGNERVLRARLSDAKFFWDQDLKLRLEDRLPKLKDIVFHEKLGTIADKAERLANLSREIAQRILGCDAGHAEQAGRLCKCDLVSGMVGEFPEVQGVMGGYYAERQGEAPDIARAIREHYSPKGPDDACPDMRVSIAVALADKLDTLVGFFGAGERPTGSKDPFALRRAALGAIRLIVENGERIGLRTIIGVSLKYYTDNGVTLADPTDDLVAFFADRLKVQQREKGVPHDLIDAVFGLGSEDDLVRLLARVAALQSFLKTNDGANLLTGYRRAVNIVRIEEKKDGVAYDRAVDAKRLVEPNEIALYENLGAVRGELQAAIALEDFGVAMKALARLRGPVDAFFDHVTVNADELSTRENRLNLLSEIRRVMHAVADFSKIEG